MLDSIHVQGDLKQDQKDNQIESLVHSWDSLSFSYTYAQ
jgi:hypothetical protein